METSVRKAGRNAERVVDLSKELSPEELERIRADAASEGLSLKAYALALIFHSGTRATPESGADAEGEVPR